MTLHGGGALLISPCPNTWLVPLLAKTMLKEPAKKVLGGSCDGVACRHLEGKDLCWNMRGGLVGLQLGQGQYLIEGSQQPRGLAGEAKAFLHR